MAEAKLPPNQMPHDIVKFTPGKRVIVHLKGYTSGHITFKEGHWTHGDVVEVLPGNKVRVKLLTYPLGVEEVVLPWAQVETVPGIQYELLPGKKWTGAEFWKGIR